MKQRRLAFMMLAFALLGTFAFIMLPSLPGCWEPRRAFAAGDGYTQHFPIVHRARPGLRDLIGLNTVQYDLAEGKDIAILLYPGLLLEVTYDNNQNDDSPSWSSTQHLILARTYPLDGEPERGNLVILGAIGRAGEFTTPVTQNENLKREFQWSPTDDISYLETTPQGRTDLWIAPAGTFTPTIVLTDVVNYRWSPNGDAIAFTANRDGDNDLFLSTPDGTTITPLTDNTADDEVFEWVSLGSELLVRRTDGTNDELWLIARTGNSERLFPNQTVSNIPLARSPDGYWVAHLAYSATGAFELHVTPTIAPPPLVATPLWTCPPDPQCFIGDVAWSPDGSGLAWRATRESQTGDYETLLVYSESDFTQSQIVSQDVFPEGGLIWAKGTEWLLFSGTTLQNPTTPIVFATDVTFGSPSPLVFLWPYGWDLKPADYRETFITPRVTP